MAEIEEAFRAKVLELCKYYCLQVWNEALNQVRVEASSTLKRVESVYYPPAIQALGSSGLKVDTTPNEANNGKKSPNKALPSVQSSSKEVELPDGAEKPAEVPKEVAHDAILPPTYPKDPSKENEALSCLVFFTSLSSYIYIYIYFVIKSTFCNLPAFFSGLMLMKVASLPFILVMFILIQT